MTELSIDGAGVHGASMLGVSWGDPSTKGADVFGTLGAYVVQGLELETVYNGGCCRGFRSVGDDNCWTSVDLEASWQRTKRFQRSPTLRAAPLR